MPDALIVDAVRTPRGKGRPDGALHDVHPQALLAQCLTALAARVGFDPEDVEDVVMGNGILAGDHSDDIARLAVLLAGWPESVPGTVLNRFCGSGQQAITFAAMGVASGMQDLVVAGSVESMSRWGATVGLATIDGGNAELRRLHPTVPQGISADLIATLDGTRHYTGSSNSVNLQGSGPYNYRPPVQYFTELAQGFSVEVGTPSLATLESIEAMVPAADRWPISDTLAYHDWHYGGNGDVASFMSALENQFGAPTSLADFERKAQMLNYVSYRAVFEGFQARLWTQNSGRLLWMTHPAWPSNHWQIYSSDYDTQASYYGVKSACEPVHAQMNLPDYSLAVVNTTRQEHRGLTLTSRVFALDGRLLNRHASKVSAAANSTLTLPPLNLPPLLATEDLVLVVLTLDGPNGQPLSRNIYWQGRNDHSQQKLNSLAPQNLNVTAQMAPRGGDTVVSVTLENGGTVPALATKLTVLDSSGKRVLPVLYSDNYISLLPHEPRKVEILCPKGGQCSNIQLRGWNVVPASVHISGGP